MFSKIVDIVTPQLDIKDNSIVAISGFNMATTPEYLILELYRRYNEQGHPKNIFIISDALPAVPGRALDQIAEGLYEHRNQEFLRGALMPFLGFSPWLQKLVTDNRIECYGWPIGITAYWFREIGSGRPGLLTKIGVDTFLDPRKEGAALNERAKRNASCRVSVFDIEGVDYLLYQAPKPNYALIRASISDENANLSLQDEGLRGTVLSIAQATKARPHQGTVIAQVRCLLELIRLFANKRAPVLVNLGIGIPALISLVAAEEDLTQFIITVLESGPWGGLALSGNDFGLAISPFALSTIPDVFSSFEGGIIDAASLGFLQVDKKGNVNPSMLADKIFGPGGFPVIAGGAPRIYFAGSFTAGKSEISISDNRITILHDGAIPKFIESVFKVVFSGYQALKYEQEILYITERAVFRLTGSGIILEEVAPGIDLDKDITSKMGFKPINIESLKEMDKRIFNDGKMGIKDELMQKFKTPFIAQKIMRLQEVIRNA